ncbi:DUF4476 domain-containing protein [Hymenobacter weizhouensis]|uniref:DUF4476 domain-containing protein n=1 Tax=Hymenobacter sp. YIM 151500-1 TaxID=2987689 RepID=UPI002225C827|nr:DUF4476 domain-containing protein [Hymenobacter sp. YIM 151500-1]UYZ62179.1 DUF4476 domain-containing protein [Hymenobacter sp. YIM 151500-1]
MKKALLFCVSLCLLLSNALQAAPAVVNFSSERGIPFYLSIDGYPLTPGGTRQVRLDRLRPGLHWAEFVIPVSYGRNINYRTKIFLDPGLETSYVLLTRNGFPPELRKISAMPIQRGGYYGGPRGPYPPVRPSRPSPDYDTHYPDQGPYGNEPAYPAHSYILSPQEADELLQTVQRQSFDDNKLALIREALHETSLPADDARRLVSTISFDRNRIELAKYLYTRVADRQNFYRVYDVFQFQSSIREVQQYIESHRP